MNKLNDLNATSLQYILVFSLDEPLYALPLSSVERVVPAVEITPLPKAPEFVLGVINVHGQVIPVMDIRQRLRLPTRPVGLEDRFILARLGGDEFTILLSDCNLDSSRTPITHLKKNLEQTNPTASSLHNLSLSTDLAHFDPAKPATINDLLEQADAEIYTHKQNLKKEGA
jgi:hypothetical protein